jgi:hypothetical protein
MATCLSERAEAFRLQQAGRKDTRALSRSGYFALQIAIYPFT